MPSPDTDLSSNLEKEASPRPLTGPPAKGDLSGFLETCTRADLGRAKPWTGLGSRQVHSRMRASATALRPQVGERNEHHWHDCCEFNPIRHKRCGFFTTLVATLARGPAKKLCPVNAERSARRAASNTEIGRQQAALEQPTSVGRAEPIEPPGLSARAPSSTG